MDPARTTDGTGGPRRRRWFRFSLRTLLVVVAICGTVGFWVARQIASQRASRAYETAYAKWDAEMITTAGLCRASLELYHAQAAVPFANRQKAAAAHLARVDAVRQEYRSLIPVTTWGDLDEPDRVLRELDTLHAEAERLANQ
jgi:hypothetical protein